MSADLTVPKTIQKIKSDRKCPKCGFEPLDPLPFFHVGMGTRDKPQSNLIDYRCRRCGYVGEGKLIGND